MSRTQKMMKNTMVLGIGIFISRIINLFTTPIINAHTSGADFGLINYINTIILSFVVPVCALQIEQGLFRFIVDANKDQEKIKKSINSAGFLLFVITTIILVIAFFIPIDGFSGSYKYLLLLYIAVEIIVHMLRSVTRGFEMYRPYSISSIISVVINFVTLFTCIIYFDLGYISVIIALTLADVFSSIYLIFKTKYIRYLNIRFINRTYCKEILNYSLPFVPNVAAWYVNVFSDQLLIEMILGYTANGIYSMALKIPSIINLLYPAFNLAWIESAIKSADDQDSDKYYNKVFKQSFLLISAGTALLMAGSPLLNLLFNQNPDTMSAKYYIPILIIATYFYCFIQFFSSIYIAAKESSKMTKTTVIAAIINVVINLLFLAHFGVVVAAVSTLISNAVLMAYRYYDINKRYQKLVINKRLMILSLIVFTVLGALSVSSSWIVWGVSLILAVLFAWFLAGDIAMIFIKKFLQRKAA